MILRVVLVCILSLKIKIVHSFAGNRNAFCRYPFSTRHRCRTQTTIVTRNQSTDNSIGNNSIDNNDNSDDNNNYNNDSGNVHIPSGGFSVSDDLDESQRDRYKTQLVPLKNVPGVAQIFTKASIRESFEPIRYLISLSAPPFTVDTNTSTTSHVTNEKTIENPTFETQFPQPTRTPYVLVDVPPYSTTLVDSIKQFIGPMNPLIAMIITNRDSIHYDNAPAVFSIRRADLDLWKQAFPTMSIVGYRLDVPRDCRDSMTQILDGYGPFALQEEEQEEETRIGKVDTVKERSDSTEKDSIKHYKFVETGRPLTYMSWIPGILEDVKKGKPPPDDDMDDLDVNKEIVGNDSNNDDYTGDKIRQREQGKRLLAIFTPGHSFGSVSYVFPERMICCSGYTIPVEDMGYDINDGYVESSASSGPTLDCRGYVTTNKAGIERQIDSAKKLINQYSDRFHTILPSRGNPLFVDVNFEQSRKAALLDLIKQYEKVGRIYEQLGIISSE